MTASSHIVTAYDTTERRFLVSFESCHEAAIVQADLLHGLGMRDVYVSEIKKRKYRGTKEWK